MGLAAVRMLLDTAGANTNEAAAEQPVQPGPQPGNNTATAQVQFQAAL